MIFKGWGNGFFKEIFTPGVHRSSWCPLLIFYLNLLKYFLLLIFCLGLTFDLYDGKRGELEGESVLSKDQLKAALVEPPSLLEMLSHSFFIGGYFVGPQFNFRKFKQFASPGFISQLPGSPISYGFRRFGMSIFYMLIHIIGSMYVPAMWPSSPEWSNTSFISYTQLTSVITLNREKKSKILPKEDSCSYLFVVNIDYLSTTLFSPWEKKQN